MNQYCFTIVKIVPAKVATFLSGPQIEMCNKMLYDMMYFTVILFFVIFAYGIAVQALMYPGENEPFFSVVWGILISPYFEMVGNLNFQGIGASSTSKCDGELYIFSNISLKWRNFMRDSFFPFEQIVTFIKHPREIRMVPWKRP